jgi:hypothetical protein
MAAMSILFHKNSKKVMKIVGGVVALLVGLSMILLYAPGFVTLF